MAAHGKDTFGKGVAVDFGVVGKKIYRFQTFTFRKRMFSDVRYAFGNRDRRKTYTIIKSKKAYVGKAALKGHTL